VEMTYTPPVEILARFRSRSFLAGGIGVLACILGFVLNLDEFFPARLIAYWFWLGISLGSMALMMIQHLSGGQWGVFRRVFEASRGPLPLVALLFLPVLAGMTYLYPWTHPDQVAADEVLRHKALYLNSGFFVARAALYFVRLQ